MIEAILYCDASVKAGFAGIGICLVDISGRLVQKVSKRLPAPANRSNTEIEASAIIESIKLAHKHGFTDVRIYTDSQSLVQAAHRGSARRRQTRAFIAALQQLSRLIKFSLKWVRGHAGQRWNCLCDRLAKTAKWVPKEIFVKTPTMSRTPALAGGA